MTSPVSAGAWGLWRFHPGSGLHHRPWTARDGLGFAAGVIWDLHGFSVWFIWKSNWISPAKRDSSNRHGWHGDAEQQHLGSYPAHCQLSCVDGCCQGPLMGPSLNIFMSAWDQWCAAWEGPLYRGLHLDIDPLTLPPCCWVFALMISDDLMQSGLSID